MSGFWVFENFGTDGLLGSKIVSFFADITRNQLRDENELIKILCDKGTLDCLKEATQKSPSERELAVKRAITKLPKFLQGSEDADIMLRQFADVLGWKLHKPQAITPPKAAQPQETVLQSAPMKSRNIDIPSVGSIHKFADIDWRVLEVRDGKALLISEKIIGKRWYHEQRTSITWEQCTLRKYLNGEFYNRLGAAKSAIADTRNTNPNNPEFGTPGGNETVEKIFLLSIGEAKKYFYDDNARIACDANGSPS